MKHLSPTDPVPSLRGDVVFSQRPTGSGAEVIQIRPIGFGEGTRLHGFELSIARMLDGRRSAQDVVNRATRLGLPLSVPALEGFINHLQAHHLLARSPGEAAASSPWSERFEWDPIVRQQYQAALKSLRAGEVDAARLKLDRLLSHAPLLEEARGLRTWLAQHPSGAAGAETFHDTFVKAENHWLRRGRLAPVTSFPPAELDLQDLRAVRPSMLPYAILMVVIAVMLAGLLIPFPARVSAPAQLTPVTVTPAIAAVGGTIGEVHVDEGQWVSIGDPLVTLSEPEGAGLVAEADGVVRNITAAEDKPVLEGQQLMEIEDTRQLRLTAQLDPSQARHVRAGQQATIALGSHRATTKVSGLSGNQLVTSIDNTGRQMEPGNAVVDIDIGSRSLLQRMFR